MSHSANTVAEHRLHPSKDLTPRVTEWEVHVGLVGYLYVVGPGPKAMLLAYRSAIPAHLAVVRDAVILLNQTRREDMEAADDEIRAALIESGWVEED